MTSDTGFKEGERMVAEGLDITKEEFFQRVSDIANQPENNPAARFVDGQITAMRDAISGGIFSNPELLNQLPENAGWVRHADLTQLSTLGGARNAADGILDAAGIRVPKTSVSSSVASTPAATVGETDAHDNPKNLIYYLQKGMDSAPVLTGNNDLTETDSIVLSHLSYMSKVMDNANYRQASLSSNVTIKEYCSDLLEFLPEKADVPQTDEFKSLRDSIDFLDALSKNQRYNNLRIGANEALWSGEVSDHVLVIEYPNDNGAFFAFEGTDGTVSGWRTDTAYGREVDSIHEEWARKTFENYASQYANIDMGGHSRGGHLAVYSLLTVDPEIADRVRSVYSLDGPGFSKAFLEKYRDEINAYGEKIHNIRPCCSMVGAITPGGETIGSVKYIPITTSEADGFIGHDDMNWYIGEDGSLDSVPPTSLSLFMQDMTAVLCDNLTDEELAYFGEALFEFGRDYSDDSYGQTLKFEAILDNILAEIADGDLENVGAMLGTVCVLIDRGVLYEILPEDWKLPAALMLGNVLYHFPRARVIYNTIRIAVKVVAKLYSLYVQVLEKRRQEKRAKYLASNPTAIVTEANILEAIDCMRNAETSMRDAKAFYNSLYTHVELNLVDLLGGLFTVGKFAKILFGSASMNGSTKVKKMYSALGRVKDYWENTEIYMQGILPDYGRSKEIMVSPGQLKSAANAMLAQVNKFEKAFHQANQEVEDLYADKSWQGEDYQIYLKDFGKSFDSLPAAISDMKAYCEGLQNIASTYARVQEDSVSEFQRM